MKAETPMVTYLLDQHDIEKVVPSLSFFRAAVNKLLFADIITQISRICISYFRLLLILATSPPSG